MNTLKYIKRLIPGVMLVFNSSCADFLNTTPDDFLTAENYYRNEQEVFNALGTVYRHLATFECYGQYLAFEGVVDDLGYYNWKWTISNMQNRLYSWDYTSSQGDLKKIWANLYSGIAQANNLLANIDKANMDEDKRETFRQETLFLRAYFYWLLVTNWGDVPVRNEMIQSPSDVNVPRTPQKEVYEMILGQMEACVESGALKTAADFNHATRVTLTVAQAITARVALKMAGKPLELGQPLYAKALAYAEAVSASGLHGLNPSYEQVFVNHAADLFDNTHRESMWEANFVGNSVTDPGKSNGYSFIGTRIGIECPEQEKIGYCYAYFCPRLKLHDLYDQDPADVRKKRNISTFKYDSKGNPFNVPVAEQNAAKWRRSEEVVFPRHKNYSPTNFPIIRYADVLLMIAEAENELNGPTEKATGALNEVRKRANAFAFNEAGQEQLADADRFRQVLQEERARELCFEGIRKHDLIRWGIYVESMQHAAIQGDSDARSGSRKEMMTYVARMITERYIYYPIPQSELQLNNKMTQNKGW